MPNQNNFQNVSLPHFLSIPLSLSHLPPQPIPHNPHDPRPSLNSSLPYPPNPFTLSICVTLSPPSSSPVHLLSSLLLHPCYTSSSSSTLSRPPSLFSSPASVLYLLLLHLLPSTFSLLLSSIRVIPTPPSCRLPCPHPSSHRPPVMCQGPGA
ncbi:hypothetical protein Pcinc_042798 [Petrolisthes cinctipes]|uniref:Uncharacterized protein n=1 Tax=Petrolisthes cinctipes TaxID=88211 RepID=A0AAE1BH77_PETCI|nr:hypothetical protein Pcinc_042798 [Petrolisthes cinctipes]